MKKKLKIAILIDQLVPGGVQKSAIAEARELQQLNCEVTLFVLVRLKKPSPQFINLTKKTKVIYLSDYNPVIFRQPLRIPYFAFLTHLHLLNPFFVHRYTKLTGFDFLISHGTTTCITAETIAKKYQLPYLAYIWDPMLYILKKVYSDKPIRLFFPIIKPLIKYYENSFLKSASLVVTSSKIHQQFLKSNYQVSPIIIYPGCKLIPKTNKSFTAKYILGYTRWELAKNPQLFIYLAQNLPRSKFLIAGSWTNHEEESYFRNLVKQNNLESRLQLVTDIPEKDLNQLAKKCLVWVHPNFEAFGMAGLEMASLGLPIIIPKNSGITEIFQHQIHGFFPNKNNQQQYLHFIQKLINQPSLARKMGQRASLVARKFTWNYHANNVRREITKILQTKKVTVLETCMVIGSILSGGDKLMEPMARELLNKDLYSFTIISSYLGAKHWRNAGFKQIISLVKNVFDHSSQPVPVFLTYLIRIFQTTRLLLKLNQQFICSSTNILPDVLPAYLAKRYQPSLVWIARIHHLIPPPHQRVGYFIVNLVSYLMQFLALQLIKHQANQIIVLNQNLKHDLISKGFDSRKITTLGAGVNFEKISQQRPLAKTPSFAGIFVGRLHPTKGIFDLPVIWAEVIRRQPNAQLAIVGSGPSSIKRQLKQKINQLRLANQIKLLGYVSDKQLISLLKKSSVFLFTDREAGWGLAVAEAMAAGLPVVGYDIGILGQIFKQGYIKVPTANYAKFAQEIDRLLSNKAEIKSLGRQAIKEAQKHQWPLIANQFQKIINLA